MTSRERVRKAISHQQPDRVPIDIGGTKATGIHVDEYADLVRYLGIDALPAKVYEQFQMLARVDETMMRWLHSDVIQLENLIETWGLRNEDWKPWTTHRGNSVLMPGGYHPVRDEKGYLRLYDAVGRSVAVMSPTGLYFERDCPTEMSAGNIAFTDPQVWKESIPLFTEEELCVLEKRARFLRDSTSYSIHGGFAKGGLGTNGLFAGHTITDWLCILATEKDYAFSILQATAERAIENLELYLQAVGSCIDTILVSGTDFGTQKGELFDPRLFKELYVPNYKLINDCVHRHGNVKTMLHSCGSVWNIIELLIEAGVDILNPVQTNTANMEPARLKEKYGKKIVLWGGGIETQTILPHGTAYEVKEHVKERLRILAPGGGFVFAAIHNIQHGVPPENIEAMVQAVLE